MKKPRNKKRTSDHRDGQAEKEKASASAAKKTPQEDDSRPDYGGLPDLDLKKNLGCG